MNNKLDDLTENIKELNGNLADISDKLNDIASVIGECSNGLAFLRGTYKIAEAIEKLGDAVIISSLSNKVDKEQKYADAYNYMEKKWQ